MKNLFRSCCIHIWFLIGTILCISGCGGGGSGIIAPIQYVEKNAVISVVPSPEEVGGFLYSAQATTGDVGKSVVYRTYNSQILESLRNKNVGRSFALKVPRTISLSSVFTISIPFESTGTGDVILAQESGGTQSFPKVETTLNNGVLQFRLEGNDLEVCIKSGIVEGDGVWLTFSAVESLSPSSSRGRSFDGKLLEYAPDSNGGFRVLDTPGVLAGKRVAVIVHGLNNSASDMLDTYLDIVFPIFNSTHPQEYDYMLFYEYKDNTEGIEENGRRLSESLVQLGGLESTQLDFYGHSMGGLVSRAAIELNPIGLKTSRLFMFGTPNNGIPLETLRMIRFLDRVFEGYRDLRTNGDFLNRLNGSHISEDRKVAYFVIAGTNQDYQIPVRVNGVGRNFDVGRRAAASYQELGTQQHGDPYYYFPIDGIVSIRSAHFSQLNQNGKVSSDSMKPIFKNHTFVASGNDVLNLLRPMLNSSGSGGIR